MAEGIFRQSVRGRGDYQVVSAGLGALEGQPPSSYAIQAVKELGIDISALRSRMLTAELVQQADYIFGMTHSHLDTVAMLYQQATAVIKSSRELPRCCVFSNKAKRR